MMKRWTSSEQASKNGGIKTYKEMEANMEEYKKEELELKAKLAQKKNAVRKVLKEKGILQRKGANTFDKYSYFSEAQYKELFTDLFAECGLELTASVMNIKEYEGTAKQPFGRIVCVAYLLTDIDTGFSERSDVYGDGMDKGDKGIYKAYTGSLKYYLANTFMVATGDDPEKHDKTTEKKISKATAKTLHDLIESYGLNVATICDVYEHKKLEDFTENEYANCLKRLEATKREQEDKA